MHVEIIVYSLFCFSVLSNSFTMPCSTSAEFLNLGIFDALVQTTLGCAAVLGSTGELITFLASGPQTLVAAPEL